MNFWKVRSIFFCVGERVGWLSRCDFHVLFALSDLGNSLQPLRSTVYPVEASRSSRLLTAFSSTRKSFQRSSGGKRSEPLLKVCVHRPSDVLFVAITNSTPTRSRLCLRSQPAPGCRMAVAGCCYTSVVVKICASGWPNCFHSHRCVRATTCLVS